MTLPRTAVLMAGPTASGKSALALELAARLDGVIVNADSMQVYRDLHVLSARPDRRDERAHPHRLYGFVDAQDSFSTGRWLDQVKPVLEQIERSGKTAIFVGGTGLYFKALVQGLAPIPEIEPAIRIKWRARLEHEGAEALHKALLQLDPKTAAGLDPHDGQRIARAGEVAEATGRSLKTWQSQPAYSVLSSWRAVRVVVMPSRDQLYQSCEQRFDAMLKHGALEEVRALTELDLACDLPVMKALGVTQLIAHLDGKMSLEEAGELAKRDTRRYAKRQMTWFRNQFADWRTCQPGEVVDSVLGEIGGFGGW